MKCGHQGSSSIELVFVSMWASVFFLLCLFISDYALSTHRVHALASHAADLGSIGVERERIEEEIMDYGRSIGVVRDIHLEIHRYDDLPAARFYRLLESVVTITMSVPNIFGGGEKLISARAVLEEDIL